MIRRDWDATWMGVADVIAKRSRCESRQIGAVIVDLRNRPIAMGYNGTPAGLELADDATCGSFCPRRQSASRLPTYSDCVTVHAETNALMFADRSTYEAGTLYVTSAVCWDCGKLVSNSGIRRVMMRVGPDDQHRDPQRTIDFMVDCGLLVGVLDAAA